MADRLGSAYDVYHDESAQAGYWHGILLVPRASRGKVLAHMAKIRKQTSFEFPFSFKDIKSGGYRFQSGRAAVQLAVAAMKQSTRGISESVYTSRRCYDFGHSRQAAEYHEIIRIHEPLGLRFIVFRERDCHRFLDPEGDFLDHGAKVETTFRMGIAGGLHLLFDSSCPMVIGSLHFDGHQHYHRRVDEGRVIERLKRKLRDYCQVDDEVLLDDRPSDHRLSDAQPYDDCQLLQLTDLLIGSFRLVLSDGRAMSVGKRARVQMEVAHPVANLVERWKRGRKRMERSRWHRGFCISQCYLEDGSWRFAPLPTRMDSGQLDLEFS